MGGYRLRIFKKHLLPLHLLILWNKARPNLNIILYIYINIHSSFFSVRLCFCFFGTGHLQLQPLLSRYFCFLLKPFFHFFVFYLDIKFIVHLMHYSINIVVIIIITILLVYFVFKNLLWYCQEFFCLSPPQKKGSSVPRALFCTRIFHFGVHKPIISKVTEYTDRTFKLTFA